MDEFLLKKMIKKYIRGLTPGNVVSILKIVKAENSKKGLTKKEFLEKVKDVYKSKIYKTSPFCTYCFKIFRIREQMRAHIAMVHEDKEKKFACKNCPKTFMASKSLEYHTNICHSQAKAEVKCEVCDAKFSHQISLNRHHKIHKEIQSKIKCNICQKTFGRKDTLTKHKKSVHELEIDNFNTYRMIKSLKISHQKFECKMCKQEFNGANAEDELETHIINHCQQFECGDCKQTFSSKYNMKKHLTIHHNNDQEEFSCDKCNFKTNYKSNLKRHKKNDHPE